MDMLKIYLRWRVIYYKGLFGRIIENILGIVFILPYILIMWLLGRIEFVSELEEQEQQKANKAAAMTDTEKKYN